MPGTLGLNHDLWLWRRGVEALASAIGNVAVGGAMPNHHGHTDADDWRLGIELIIKALMVYRQAENHRASACPDQGVKGPSACDIWKPA